MATATGIFSALLIMGMTLCFSVILMILLNHNETALREFALLGLFSAAIMMLAYYVELNSTLIMEKFYAAQFGYIGKVFLCPMLLMLVVKYYGIDVPKWIQGIIYVIPVVTLFMVFSTQRTLWYYSSWFMTTDMMLHLRPGFFYYIYMIYNGLLSAAYLAVCLYKRPSLHGRDRTNNTILIIACLCAAVSLIIYLSGATRGFDITNIGVLLMVLFVSLSILQYGLLNKDEILQSMSTALVFLDNDNLLVYANRAAIKLLPVLAENDVQKRRKPVPELVSAGYATVQTAHSAYQRKISAWSGIDGRHGKLLTFDDVTEIRIRLNRDAMTGLLNHASFYPMLDEALRTNGRHGLPVTVSIADINSFKRVNDTYGHANGDLVLKALADSLRAYCGRCNDVFRYGGEEFAVIFRCGLTEAESFMQQALDAFGQKKFDFMPENVTFSYGSAEAEPEETSVELFERADQLMYARKRAYHALHDPPKR